MEQEHPLLPKGRENKLGKSIELLSGQHASGQLEAEYKQLKTGLIGFKMDAAKNNMSKNRYPNVLPYDLTRVKIECPEYVNYTDVYQDYINANYIYATIPGTKEFKSYVATQGPLPETTKDFWRMTWEQNTSNIVMLTPEVVRSVVKCDRYWPEHGKCQMYGDIQVYCAEEKFISKSLIERKFELTHSKDIEIRFVVQYQYVGWFDKKAPEDTADFLNFVKLFRSRSKVRVGTVDKVIVLCSAGVGRTGVFIALDICWSLMEANVAVYPVNVVKLLRTQRPMCVQSPEQFNFLCESILQIYNDNFASKQAEESCFHRGWESVSKLGEWKRRLTNIGHRMLQRRGNKVSPVDSSFKKEESKLFFGEWKRRLTNIGHRMLQCRGNKVSPVDSSFKKEESKLGKWKRRLTNIGHRMMQCRGNKVSPVRAREKR